MKNIFIIFLILILHTNTIKAETKYKSNAVYNNDISEFNRWLYDNGHHEYVTKKENEIPRIPL